ncbi:membrane protein insertase YidC [Clostridium sp.]|uniref:membrane protein insertase YidC n=1 Tax=Clostridium sp. TaxID=1506 RepID=UPI002A915CC3|nr:membrane protein insertase YidC [Clostridium sp.]MDY6012012.1 membrane protein insertase YidC [Clostridium sp.]
MMTLFKPITDFFTIIFDKLHHLIISVGVTDPGWAYVLAVIVLTVIIKTIILPFSIKSVKSTRKMQEFQPVIKKIQEKYKNDPQKANAEMMKVYKENNISMTGGCLPMLIPLPILMALYYTFMQISGIQGVSFLWLPNLAGKDPYYILPVLAAVSTFIPSYLMTKANPATESSGMNMMPMNIGMALMMGFMSLNFQSLLVIYWIVGGVYQLVQTYFLNVRPVMNKKKEQQEEVKIQPKNKFAMPEGYEKKRNKK